MLQDSRHADSSLVLAAAPVAGAGAGSGEATVALPGIAPLRGRGLPRIRITFGPVGGHVALASIVVAALAVVVFASSHASVLVPGSTMSFPNWEAGPLHFLLKGGVTHNSTAVNLGLSGLIVAMLIAYGIVLSTVRMLSMRTIAIAVVALHLILLMSPPLQLTDLFNYLGYARLGGLHHLNPYTHVIAQEIHDPVYRFTSWHHLLSPYGPLFTAVTYPLALVPLPVAYWALKVITVLLSLGFIALVWQCARQLGRDPRFAVVFVAANPIFLMYEVAGFHNDFFMLVPSTAAISLLLARRDRAAGAALMLAVAAKFTAILLLPFLLIAARPVRRRRDVLVGAALGAIPLIAMSLALFGFSIPNLSDQSTLLTELSIPNLVGLALHIGGGTPLLLRAGNVALVLTIAFLIRRRGDWLTSAGWATFGLIASLAWLVPWYLVWLLPLAALSTNIRLRRTAFALTVFLVATFIPATGMFLNSHGLDPLNTSAGHASRTLQHKLEQ
jgi:hypothetical protein